MPLKAAQKDVRSKLFVDLHQITEDTYEVKMPKRKIEISAIAN